MRLIVPLLLSSFFIVGQNAYYPYYNTQYYPQGAYQNNQYYTAAHLNWLKYLYSNRKPPRVQTQPYYYAYYYVPYYRPKKPGPGAQVPATPQVTKAPAIVTPPVDEGSGGGPPADIKPGRKTRRMILRRTRN